MKNITELLKNQENDQLQQLLQENPALAAGKTEQGISFLQFAAYCRNQVAIDLIRAYRKELDIFEAASIGESKTVLQLLDQNASLLSTFAPDGFTALGLASFFGHLPLVQQLLDRGADPNIPSNNAFKVTPLHSACAISNLPIAELLIQKGADVNAKQMQGVTPLHSAARNGQIDLVQLLLQHGAAVEAAMENGQTPLSLAEEQGHTEIVSMLKAAIPT